MPQGRLFSPALPSGRGARSVVALEGGVLGSSVSPSPEPLPATPARGSEGCGLRGERLARNRRVVVQRHDADWSWQGLDRTTAEGSEEESLEVTTMHWQGGRNG
ncbi:unnamed protein product [Natator depressus]